MAKSIEEYQYKDINNTTKYVIERIENNDGKDFKLFTELNGERKYGLKGISTILYRLPELVNADKNKPVFVVEGERKVNYLYDRGFVGTTNPFGAKGASTFETHGSYFKDRTVIILPDNDKDGQDHARKVKEIVSPYANSVRIKNLPGLENREDIVDWFNNGNTAQDLTELIDSKIELKPILDDIQSIFKTYIRASDDMFLFLAYWIVHTYVFKSFNITPYLHICAPEKRSGKSTTLEITKEFSFNAYWYSGGSPSGFLQVITKKYPSLFLDDLDDLMKKNKEIGQSITGILNAGFKKGNKFVKSAQVGAKWEGYQEFQTYCPKAFTTRDRETTLQDATLDRSFSLLLLRDDSDTELETWNDIALEEKKEDFNEIKTKLEEWSETAIPFFEDKTNRLKFAPKHNDQAKRLITDTQNARLLDITEVMYNIANFAKLDQGRLTDAILNTYQGESTDSGGQLIRDIYEVLTENNYLDQNSISTMVLLDQLNQLEAGQWINKRGGRGLSANHLVRMLKAFAIHPQPYLKYEIDDIIPEDKKLGQRYRGYYIKDFKKIAGSRGW